MMLLFVLGSWYLIGIFSVIFWTYSEDKEVRISDVLAAFYFGLIGPVATCMIIFWKYEDRFKGWNKVIWRK